MLDHIARAMAGNREPGLHFPGFFLGLHAHAISQSGVHMSLPYGPHCANANGDVNISALAVLADLAAGVAVREHIGPNIRMATLCLQLQFTGASARGDLHARTHCDGLLQGASATQGRAIGSIRSGHDAVCNIMASFATPSLPAGVNLVPMNWDLTGRAQANAPLTPKQMHVNERALVRRAKAALKSSAHGHSFVEHLWGHIARPVKGGASNTVPLGLHNGNRVGHVQGGVLFGIAAATAQAALPTVSKLTGASAWYISGGTGHSLRLRSRILQHGRTVGVVLTQVVDQNKRIVLEMVTNHAYPAH